MYKTELLRAFIVSKYQFQNLTNVQCETVFSKGRTNLRDVAMRAKRSTETLRRPETGSTVGTQDVEDSTGVALSCMNQA